MWLGERFSHSHLGQELLRYARATTTVDYDSGPCISLKIKEKSNESGACKPLKRLINLNPSAATVIIIDIAYCPQSQSMDSLSSLVSCVTFLRFPPKALISFPVSSLEWITQGLPCMMRNAACKVRHWRERWGLENSKYLPQCTAVRCRVRYLAQ